MDMLICTLYCLFIGVKLSDYPTAPKKLQPIQDTNMLHNACEYWWQFIKHVNVLCKHNRIVKGWFMYFSLWRWSHDFPSGVCRQFWGQWNVHLSWVFTSPLAPTIPLHKVKVHSRWVVSHCLRIKHGDEFLHNFVVTGCFTCFRLWKSSLVSPSEACWQVSGQGDDHSTWV